MPELDQFDARITAAVRSFADRAETHVDAAAVAARAAGHNAPARSGWLARTIPVPVSLLLLLGLLLLVAWSVGVVGSPPRPMTGPTPATAPSGAPVDPMAGAFVAGAADIAVTSAGTTTSRGGVVSTRGYVLEGSTTTGDPRLTGSAAYHLDIDASGTVGFATGTLRLDNADGAWQGTCTGATWNELGAGSLSCWLIGGGAYQGLSAYLHYAFPGVTGVDDVVGTVHPGEPPSP